MLDPGAFYLTALTQAKALQNAAEQRAAAAAALRGKGMWIWKMGDAEHGNPAAIVAAAKAAGLSHVLIKLWDGSYPYNMQRDIDLAGQTIFELRDAGIAVWGWGYIYGYDWQGEAAITIKRTQQYPLSGIVIDAEVEFKRSPAMAGVAANYMKQVRGAFPSMPIAMSAYRYPSLHREFPFRAFLDYCDIAMPQVYWEQAQNSAAQLARSFAEYKTFNYGSKLLYIPVGPTYKWNGWRPTAQSVRDFMDSARDTLKLPAVNFFSWDECRRDLMDVWQLISAYNYGESTPLPPPTKTITNFHVDVPARNVRTGAGLNYEIRGYFTLKQTFAVDQIMGEWARLYDPVGAYAQRFGSSANGLWIWILRGVTVDSTQTI